MFTRALGACEEGAGKISWVLSFHAGRVGARGKGRGPMQGSAATTTSELGARDTILTPFTPSCSSPSQSHLTLIDSRFVREIKPRDSAAAPSAPGLLPLQEETGVVAVAAVVAVVGIQRTRTGSFFTFLLPPPSPPSLPLPPFNSATFIINPYAPTPIPFLPVRVPLPSHTNMFALSLSRSLVRRVRRRFPRPSSAPKDDRLEVRQRCQAR